MVYINLRKLFKKFTKNEAPENIDLREMIMANVGNEPSIESKKVESDIRGEGVDIAGKITH